MSGILEVCEFVEFLMCGFVRVEFVNCVAVHLCGIFKLWVV